MHHISQTSLGVVHLHLHEKERERERERETNELYLLSTCRRTIFLMSRYIWFVPTLHERIFFFSKIAFPNWI
jgi:hypothetical protein